jgi:7-carboxy-7-deazaguanine synthase
MNNLKQLYSVMESFYTLQGEGYYSGKAAYFIRLAGCNVGCVWCDVKESWKQDIYPKFTTTEIVNKALTEINFEKHNNQNNLPIIVITGGEPLMHNLNELTHAFQCKGFKVNIETSGSSDFSGSWNWICLSPKKFKPPLNEVIQIANELKIIIYNKHDFDWAEIYASKVHTHCKLYLQPEWDRREVVTPLIINYIKDNPKWQLSLQTHKYINIP